MGNDDIVMLTAIFFFVLFTMALYRSRMIILYKINTFFSSRQIYSSNEISISNQEVADMAILILIGSVSVSSIFYANYQEINAGSLHAGWFFLAVLMLLVLLSFKTLLYSLINWTFFSGQKGKAWLSAVLFSVAVVSTLSFPLSLLEIFYPMDIINVPHCIIGIVILQKIILLIKFFVNFRPKRYGCLLFFLYFCSVEIMPTLIVWRLIREMTF